MKEGFIFISLITLISSNLFGIQNPEFEKSKGKGSWMVEWSENFTNLSIGVEPENLFILDGIFLVKRHEENMYLNYQVVQLETLVFYLVLGLRGGPWSYSFLFIP